MGFTTTPPLEPVLPTFPVARFTADQYLEMIRTEILTKKDRVELIDGVITPMAPAGDEHTWETVLLGEAFAEARSTHFLFTAGTIPFGKTHVFDPDFAQVRRGGADQRKRYVTPEEIDLIVEVANTSLKKDRTQKAIAYAEAGVPEYWIADVQGQTMIVHRSPEEGRYREVTLHGPGETIRAIAFPDIAVLVGEIFDA